MNTDVYFKNQDWRISKKVNTRNFTITYEKKGGFHEKTSELYC